MTAVKAGRITFPVKGTEPLVAGPATLTLIVADFGVLALVGWNVTVMVQLLPG